MTYTISLTPEQADMICNALNHADNTVYTSEHQRNQIKLIKNSIDTARYSQ